MNTDRNLLFGVLAFQDDFIDMAQLAAIGRAWAADKSRPIPELLACYCSVVHIDAPPFVAANQVPHFTVRWMLPDASVLPSTLNENVVTASECPLRVVIS
jgi:hypothetical protein